MNLEFVSDTLNNLFDELWDKLIEERPHHEDSTFLDRFLFHEQNGNLYVYACWTDSIWNNKLIKDWKSLSEQELREALDSQWRDSIESTLDVMAF